jgi:hypothetical protein
VQERGVWAKIVKEENEEEEEEEEEKSIWMLEGSVN